MGSLTTALVTATLALLGKIVFDVWERFRSRKAVAAAIAGELGAYFALLSPLNTANNLKNLAKQERETRNQMFRMFPSLPTTHPAYDKLADRTGLLTTVEAQSISRSDNIVTGLRLLLVSMSTEPFMLSPDNFQITRLRVIANTLIRESVVTELLIDSLTLTASQSFRSYLCGYNIDTAKLAQAMAKADQIAKDPSALLAA